MGENIFSVQGKDFFPLGMQCCNSSAYGPKELERFWDCAKEAGINTVEIPIYWEMFEPREDIFEYTMVDHCVKEADRRNLKIIFLWFGTWKNGTSKYAPAWVKRNCEKYTRVVTYEGIKTNILSPYCEANKKADTKAFLKLVEHIEEINRKKQIVIGIQVENEPGMMMRSYRDFSFCAQEIFSSEIPEVVKKCLLEKDMGEVTDVWNAGGKLLEGNWSQVFERRAEEYFSVYGVATYIEAIAKEAKKITDLPLVVNVWVDDVGFDEPGVDYPAGGPVSKVLGLWKALTPHIDVIGLDNYKLNISEYCMDCKKYSSFGNPLFLPESHAWDEAAGHTMFLAVGEYKAKGLFIFGPEAMYDSAGQIKENAARVMESMKALSAVQSVLCEFLKTGEVYAVCQEEKALEQRMIFDDTYVRIGFDAFERTDWHHGYFDTPCQRGRGLLLRDKKNVFYALGDDFRVSIRMRDDIPYSRQRPDRCIGYERVEEGYFDSEGNWCVRRVRNGDESDYGIWITHDVGAVKIVMEGGEESESI